jgi:hypothetical protein
MGEDGHVLTGLWCRFCLRRLGNPVILSGDVPLHHEWAQDPFDDRAFVPRSGGRHWSWRFEDNWLELGVGRNEGQRKKMEWVMRQSTRTLHLTPLYTDIIAMTHGFTV